MGWIFPRSQFCCVYKYLSVYLVTTCFLYRTLELTCSTEALSQRHIQYFDESFRLAVEHRLIHEYDGKSPPQFPTKPKSLVAESSSTLDSATSKNAGIHVDTKETSEASKQQQSAVADARSKFEQVLQASRQAAAAASMSIHTHSDKKLLTTDDAVADAHCQNPKSELSASLLYNQLVYVLFIVQQMFSI